MARAYCCKEATASDRVAYTGVVAILLEVIDHPDHFREPVTAAMESRLVTVPPDAPIGRLMEIFNQGMVAIVTDGDEFLGLITRSDLLNWLRRRMQG